MSETKDFKYEGKINLHKPPPLSPKIKDIQFLTPARISYFIGKEEFSMMVSVDFINRKVYADQAEVFVDGEVFEYLDAINTLPEDFYAAPPELADKVDEITSEQEQMRR